MRLIVEPEDGIHPLLRAIKSARQCIDIAIFRCDIKALERELAAAVTRGVLVQALIAHTNRGGASKLRKLESRLLKAGVTLSRTADDMVRYHGKLLVTDRRKRSCSASTTRPGHRKEPQLRPGDRQPEDRARHPERVRRRSRSRRAINSSLRVVVSPENARAAPDRFIKQAPEQLLIYDAESPTTRSSRC